MYTYIYTYIYIYIYIYIYTYVLPARYAFSMTWLPHRSDATLTITSERRSVTLVFALSGTFKCVTRLIHICDMTRPYVWYDKSKCGTWLIDMCDIHRAFTLVLASNGTWCMAHFTCVTTWCEMHTFVTIFFLFLNVVTNVRISHAWQHGVKCTHLSPFLISFSKCCHKCAHSTCVTTWRIHSCDITSSFKCETWLIHMIDMRL